MSRTTNNATAFFTHIYKHNTANKSDALLSGLLATAIAKHTLTPEQRLEKLSSSVCNILHFFLYVAKKCQLLTAATQPLQKYQDSHLLINARNL